MSSPSPSSAPDAGQPQPVAPGPQPVDLAELTLADELDGDEDLIVERKPERYLIPGPSAFFIGLAMLALLMVIAALLKHMR